MTGSDGLTLWPLLPKKGVDVDGFSCEMGGTNGEEEGDMGVPRYCLNDDFPGGVLGRFESSTSSKGESVSLICFFKFS